MKIILTFSLFVLSTTTLISAPEYNDQIDILPNSSEYEYISVVPKEFKLEADSISIRNELAGKDEISSINSSYLNFQSLQRGRRILEKKYNLYT